MFDCRKCSKFSIENECLNKGAFDDNDPSTCPFMYCPFFSFNYDLMIPRNGDFYIIEEDGVLYTPIFAELETSNYFDLRKCKVYSKNGLMHLILNLSYINVQHKSKQYVIENGSLKHIYTISIIE